MLLHRFNFSDCLCRKTDARITLEKLAKQCAGLCLVSGDCFAAGGVLLLPTLMLHCTAMLLLEQVTHHSSPSTRGSECGPLNRRAPREKCLLLWGRFTLLWKCGSSEGSNLGRLLTSRLNYDVSWDQYLFFPSSFGVFFAFSWFCISVMCDLLVGPLKLLSVSASGCRKH